MRWSLCALIVATTFGFTAAAEAAGGMGFGGMYGGMPGMGMGMGGMGGLYGGMGYGGMMSGRSMYGGSGRSSMSSGGNGYSRRGASTGSQVKPVETAQPIMICRPNDVGVSLSYSLNDFAYTIEPGQSQKLSNDRKWVILFDRGGDFGTCRYALSPGMYEFRLTDAGWDLFHNAGMNKMTSSGAAKSVVKNPLPTVAK